GRDKPLWEAFDVRWDFTRWLCGSVPSDPNLIEGWVMARAPKVKPPGGKSIDEIQEEVFETLADGEEETPVKPLVVQRDPAVKNGGLRGLVEREATVRAHLKDCARAISSYYVGKIKGERSFATKVVNCLYLDEGLEWIPILRPDGKPVTEADGTH